MQPCDDSQDCILRRGIDEAVKLILSENNTLFQSITAKLINYPELQASEPERRAFSLLCSRGLF